MKSLCALVAVLLMTAFLVPSPCLSKTDTGLIRVPDDEYVEKEKPRPEADLKREAKQLEEAVKKYATAQDFKNAGLTYLSLGRVYESLWQFDQVNEFYEKALAMFQKIGDTKGEAQTLSNLGWLHWTQGRSDDAQDSYEKTLELTRRTRDAKGEAWALYALGYLGDEQDYGELYGKL